MDAQKAAMERKEGSLSFAVGLKILHVFRLVILSTCAFTHPAQAASETFAQVGSKTSAQLLGSILASRTPASAQKLATSPISTLQPLAALLVAVFATQVTHSSELLCLAHAFSRAVVQLAAEGASSVEGGGAEAGASGRPSASGSPLRAHRQKDPQAACRKRRGVCAVCPRRRIANNTLFVIMTS